MALHRLKDPPVEPLPILEVERVLFSVWIEKAEIDWERADDRYWSGLFKQVDAEASFPGTVTDVRYVWYQALRPFEKWWVPKEIEESPERFQRPSDFLRALRYVRRNYKKWARWPEWDASNIYGREIGSLLNAKIQGMVEGLDYVDNVRVTAADDKKQLRLYRHQQSTGCCGRRDETCFVEGRVYLIGCNYGH